MRKSVSTNMAWFQIPYSELQSYLAGVCSYSQTSLIRTPKGQRKVSVLERCPFYRGHHDDITFKTPLKCGKAVNRGGGLGMETPCKYIFTGPDTLVERLEKCLELTGNCSTNYHHLITGVSAIKRLSLYVFALWGQDLVSVVRIRGF